ncbi:MAG: hypothetical protein SOS24_04530 [Clostridia bacterium]|nr:hypothetical protein [Clostridia bacterium]
MKQKLISVMIIISALAGLLPGAAFAEEDTQLIEKSFTYVEDFDSIEDGKLPEGWTLYRNKSSNSAKTIKAEVRNGALELTDNNYYSKGYLIFDIPGLQDVYSKNLTMECDITLGNSLGIECDNRDTDCVGFAYAFDESKIDAAKITDADGVKVVDGGVPDETSFRVKMFTNKGESTTKQILLNEKYNKSSLYRNVTVTSNEDKINTAGTAQKMKLKIEVIDINYQPQIYLNGNKVENSLGTRVDPDRTGGKIGLYINDTAVTIDNIVVTAKGKVPDIKTYEASFITPNGKYADAEDAKADVMVSECDCFGNPERDVTGEAQIDASEDIDGNITITVSYGEFTKTLTTKVADFDLISVSQAEAFSGGLRMKVSNNSKKTASAVLIVCPMKSGVPFGKGIYYKTVTLEPKEENKEAEFTFEYEGDDMPDSYKLYFIDSITNGFRATAPMINVNN